MPRLQVIIASTRPGRVGLPIGHWAAAEAARHGGFDVELVDLAEVGLPLLDEPDHPRMGQYVHEHTKQWSAKVSAADAFIFVTPEYNYGPAPALLNAIDYLYAEWAYKPVGFVSYGGVAAGLRAVQVTKQVITTLRMMPVPDGVAIPMVFQHLGPDGFTPPQPVAGAMAPMVDELLRVAEAFTELRKAPLPAPPPPPAPGAEAPPMPLAGK